MPTLHLGIIEIPYGLRDLLTQKLVAQAKKKKTAKPLKASVHVAAETTGDVAEILEGKYHVYEHFWGLHQNDIAKSLEQSLADAIEALMMGVAPAQDPFVAATSGIETEFKKFLSSREMDALGYPGIPTEAAQKGVSHRFLHPYAKRAPRPSFIDTGTYQAAFKVWVD